MGGQADMFELSTLEELQGSESAWQDAQPNKSSLRDFIDSKISTKAPKSML